MKVVEKLLPIHEAQVISYLKATGCPLALLINFNEQVLRHGVRRIVLTRKLPGGNEQDSRKEKGE